MKISNYTPHEINIIDINSVESKPEIRKLISVDPTIIVTIPSSGQLNVKFDIVDGEPINGIPTRNKIRIDIDAIPEDVEVAIVSGLYASATSDPRAYTVIDPVFDETGRKVIGCLAIGKVINNP